MRPLEPFDATHPRCVWPVFGQECADAFEASPHTISTLANAMGISHEVVRGYRRGFGKPTTVNAAKLGDLLGRTFTLDEPKADRTINAAAHPHIAALKALGYIVEIRKVAR